MVSPVVEEAESPKRLDDTCPAGTLESSMSGITNAKELLKVERQIAKVEAILEQLELRRAALLAALSKREVPASSFEIAGVPPGSTTDRP